LGGAKTHRRSGVRATIDSLRSALPGAMHPIAAFYYLVSVPISVLFILNSRRLHPAYGMTLGRKLGLGMNMFFNTLRIRTGTSYKAHLVMALKLLEAAPDEHGIVVECGTWKGGSAVNLSLVCAIVGRRLLIFDSFAGLPVPDPQDREGHWYQPGDYAGSVKEVKRNIERWGSPEVCELVPGWFEDTLPLLQDPVMLAFVDVDLEQSLDTCVRHLYPRLTDSGYIFIDEAVSTDYCALFYSESWWDENFDRKPPGLIGAGVGLPLGEYYAGPWAERMDHPLQHATAGAYMRKNSSGYWSYRARPSQKSTLAEKQDEA
jgi:O-methyltransferase